MGFAAFLSRSSMSISMMSVVSLAQKAPCLAVAVQTALAVGRKQ